MTNTTGVQSCFKLLSILYKARKIVRNNRWSKYENCSLCTTQVTLLDGFTSGLCIATHFLTFMQSEKIVARRLEKI